jgi:uncharacterized membrane protein
MVESNMALGTVHLIRGTTVIVAKNRNTKSAIANQMRNRRIPYVKLGRIVRNQGVRGQMCWQLSEFQRMTRHRAFYDDGRPFLACARENARAK